ncbi:MAG: hypothetical protein QM817_39630 [Archangium sp.]
MAICSNCGALAGDATSCPACGRKIVAAPAAPPMTITSTAQPIGAQCALHPQNPAVMTCERCGTFGCALCRSNVGGLCEKCAASGPRDKIRKVAAAQRTLIKSFGVGLLLIPLTLMPNTLLGEETKLVAVFSLITAVLSIAVRIVMLVATYRLAAALDKGIPVLWSLGTFLPGCVGIIVLLVLSSHATTYLRANGVQVGFFGATDPV